MRTMIKMCVLALGVASAAAQAGTIVVADSTAAVMSTDYAKKTFDKLNTDMKPQRERLDQLRKELSSIEEKFQKNSAIMGEKEKNDMQVQARQKLEEFNNLAQAVQKRAQDVQQEMIQKMYPKLEAAVDEIRKSKNIDIIIERKNVIWSEPTSDITKEVTTKLNAAMSATAGK